MYRCSQNNHYKRPFNENIIRDYCNYQCKEMAIEIYLAKVPSLAHNMHKTPSKIMFIKSLDRYLPQILIRAQTNFPDKAVSRVPVFWRRRWSAGIEGNLSGRV